MSESTVCNRPKLARVESGFTQAELVAQLGEWRIERQIESLSQ